MTFRAYLNDPFSSQYNASIEVSNLKHTDNALMANLKMPTLSHKSISRFVTPNFKLKGIRIEMHVTIAWPLSINVVSKEPFYDYTFSVKISQSSHQPSEEIICVFNSNTLGIADVKLTAFKEVIYIMHKSTGSATSNVLSFDVNFKMVSDVANPYKMFKTLYDDTDLTDFELRAEDGSIKVHKAVLAASSPILRLMLTGPWKEAVEGAIDISETSRTTLEDFKTYLYLRKIPDKGCEKLLLLAHYYQMSHLESECINQIVRTATSSNVFDLCHFACVQRMTKLFKALMDHMLRKGIQIEI